ncbi:molybdopterin converting factor subunit 1 [Pendulispora rubella]|uniref:Molybdopterin synthase sulfur carrier subunit n=1 Tax=Pendulispora rubella TaxID=2741070 RepID=A0ABZ2LAA0_9BACT
MHVRVLYFAAVRELVGRDEESLELPRDVATVGAFYTYIASVHPELAGRMGHVRIARNEAFATQDEILEPGDVLALIPPVSGGA